MTAFFIVTAIIIFIVILMNLIRTKPKQDTKSMSEAVSRDPDFQEMKGLFEIMERLNENGTDQDIMPDGYGEFGLDITNPIPVNTVLGSISYLGRLRTNEGKKIQYERIGSMIAPNIDQMIDQYKIFESDKEIANLFICPYNKKNSERPPKGFTISAL